MIYVDDITITRINDTEANKIEEHLTTYFEVKKLGSLQYFLGIKIE